MSRSFIGHDGWVEADAYLIKTYCLNEYGEYDGRCVDPGCQRGVEAGDRVLIRDGRLVHASAFDAQFVEPEVVYSFFVDDTGVVSLQTKERAA